MKLTTEAFARARNFLLREARPLERALYRFEFEAGDAAEVFATLLRFRNDDGGFGHGLEPDLRLPASSVLATSHALHTLHAVGAAADDELVAGATGWLVEDYDPALGAWRSVPREGEQHPHANHWAWSLHEDGTRWPVGVLPRAEVLSHLYRASGVPAALLEDQTRRLVADFEASENPGADALLGCDLFVRTQEAPTAAREAVAARLREVGDAAVNRNPQQWHTYVPKPLKLAPMPHSILAEILAADVQRNLDYEIAHQQADGCWAPFWSWNDAYPDVWAVAKREWCGHLTLEMLRSLRAHGRIEGD